MKERAADVRSELRQEGTCVKVCMGLLSRGDEGS